MKIRLSVIAGKRKGIFEVEPSSFQVGDSVNVITFRGPQAETLMRIFRDRIEGSDNANPPNA